MLTALALVIPAITIWKILAIAFILTTFIAGLAAVHFATEAENARSQISTRDEMIAQMESANKVLTVQASDLGSKLRAAHRTIADFNERRAALAKLLDEIEASIPKSITERVASTLQSVYSTGFHAIREHVREWEREVVDRFEKAEDSIHSKYDHLKDTASQVADKAADKAKSLIGKDKEKDKEKERDSEH